MTLAQQAGYLALGVTYGVAIALIVVALFILFCFATTPGLPASIVGRHRATPSSRLWTLDVPRARSHRRA